MFNRELLRHYRSRKQADHQAQRFEGQIPPHKEKRL